MTCYKESGKNTYRYQVIYSGKWLNNLYDYEQFQHLYGLNNVSTPDSSNISTYPGRFGTMLLNKVVQYSQDAIFPLALA